MATQPPQWFDEKLKKFVNTPPAAPPTVPDDSTGPPAPPPTREQRYEQGLQQAPMPQFVKDYLAPSTLGEAAGQTTFEATSPLTAFPGTAWVPWVASPIAAAGAGYLEPSNDPLLSGQRFKRAGIEGAKQIGFETIGKAGTTFTENLTRGLFKGRMIQSTTNRIANGAMRLIENPELTKDISRSAEDLEKKIGSGELTDRAGKALGDMRQRIINTVDAFKPGREAQRVPLDPNIPLDAPGSWMNYRGAVPEAGEKFHMPDVVRSGKNKGTRIFADMSIEQAMEHVKRLQELSWTPKGAETGGELSGAYRQAAHDARDEIITRLEEIGKKIGQPDLAKDYARASADYGTSLWLRDVLNSSRRTTRIGGETVGVLDQGKVFDRTSKEIDDLRRLKGNKAIDFMDAVSPTGAKAQPETRLRPPHLSRFPAEPHAGFEIPGAYMPETRKVIPQPGRALSSVYATPLYGAPVMRTWVDPATNEVSPEIENTTPENPTP